jgi:uncharacterized membrane protein|tara:strand:- start:4347 stop:4604 length:258 start_codon:yes stop_codon:yes gene_type:complete
MNKKTKFLTLMATGIAMVITAESALAAKKDMEKCYGVSKAEKNDCADKLGKHSCAGQSATDSNKSEWVYLPKGVCNKLVGGELNS